MADPKTETKVADDKKVEAAKKQIAENRAARDAAVKTAESNTGNPTPTQEENDLAKMGVHILEHAPDGSAEQQFPMKARAMDAGGGSGSNYQTRAVPRSGDK